MASAERFRPVTPAGSSREASTWSSA